MRDVPRTFSKRLRFACILLLAAGCQDQRASLEGQATYANKPIAAGVVRLFPLDGTKGSGTAITIQDGQFAAGLDVGLVAGRYRVEVRATETTGPLDLPDEGIPGEAPPKELQYDSIPARYNDQSEIAVTLTVGSNHHNLELPRDQEWENRRDAEIPDWVRVKLRPGK